MFKLLLLLFTLISIIYAERKAAIFSPYPLVPGGSERYLLIAACMFQDRGMTVDLLIESNKYCKDKKCVHEIVNQLRIPINMNKLNIVLLEPSNSRKLNYNQNNVNNYEIFFSFGARQAFPEYFSINAIYNIYLWQYVKDHNSRNNILQDTEKDYRVLASYTHILVSSRHGHYWYSSIMSESYLKTRELNLVAPTMSILHPPIDPYREINKDNLPTICVGKESLSSCPIKIMIIGRFSIGKINHGHYQALQIFRDLKTKTNKNIELIIAGNSHVGVESTLFIDRLKEESLSYNLTVKFIVNGSPSEVEEALASSSILWHLSGIKQSSSSSTENLKQGGIDDSSSLEYFGIAIVEAMGVGLIPIVLNKGGTKDIIEHKVNGILADNGSDFIKQTLYLINEATNEQINSLRLEGLKTAASFHSSKFKSSFYTLMFRGVSSKKFRDLVEEYYPKTRELKLDIKSFETDPNSVMHPVVGEINEIGGYRDTMKKIAVIIEPGVNAHFEFCCRNVMYNLGPEWSLVVYHSHDNSIYVKNSLSNVPNVYFEILKTDISNVVEYNRMIKTPKFWVPFIDAKVLLFQSDSVMLQPGMNKFLKYDYIGAPWNIHTNDRVVEALKNKYLINGVGNGGFSLRTGSVMYKIANLYGKISADDEQEDMFYAHYLETDGFAVGTRVDAYNFAREVRCEDVIKQAESVPMAIHAAWYYIDPIEINPQMTQGLKPPTQMNL